MKYGQAVIIQNGQIYNIQNGKLPPCMARNALGYEFDSAARLSKRPGSL